MLSQAQEQVLGTYRAKIKVWVELVPFEDSLHVSMMSFQLLLGLGLCDLWLLLNTDLLPSVQHQFTAVTWGVEGCHHPST